MADKSGSPSNVYTVMLIAAFCGLVFAVAYTWMQMEELFPGVKPMDLIQGKI